MIAFSGFGRPSYAWRSTPVVRFSVVHLRDLNGWDSSLDKGRFLRSPKGDSIENLNAERDEQAVGNQFHFIEVHGQRNGQADGKRCGNESGNRNRYQGQEIRGTTDDEATHDGCRDLANAKEREIGKRLDDPDRRREED